ncbi:hypothetical protein PROFUN_04670 [Planoprotostelium fungivorum]|uniref:Uncharacterized protein n=1 Tax=Planoprotostelium fungivorum TaxID=1890364 RepID=A0A2P6NUJ2_9EUKA|nr:hypothetical protein PROFUN_04670 [Planoprotostelium fungivorum]
MLSVLARTDVVIGRRNRGNPHLSSNPQTNLLTDSNWSVNTIVLFTTFLKGSLDRQIKLPG